MPLAARRAEVRVDVELAAKADQALLGAHGRAVELGQPDGAEQDGVGDPARRERLRRQRVAVAWIAAPPKGCSSTLTSSGSASSTRTAAP